LDYGHVITFSAFGPAPVDLRYSQWSQNYTSSTSDYRSTQTDRHRLWQTDRQTYVDVQTYRHRQLEQWPMRWPW